MSEITKIKAKDMRLVDDLFGMGGGYVLDFSDRTFAEFFDDELGIDIDDDRFRAEGGSKAKRLRYLLRISPTDVRLRVINALWEYREELIRRGRMEDEISNSSEEYNRLVSRIKSNEHVEDVTESVISINEYNLREAARLRNMLLELNSLNPQERGFAFEKFLKELFKASGLLPRSSFRLTGEQIDGSFELSAETYLLEAKWVNQPVGGSELWAFNGKVEEKAAWTRGLFVSESGFSPDGLSAFGRGKRLVCMDGLDLYDMLDRALPFNDVMARKVRCAAETGKIFARVRDLFS